MSKLSSWKTIVLLWVFCAATAIALPAQTFTTLVKFHTLVNFGATNGANPYSMPLIQGTDGDFYGTTDAGGTSDAGTVFKITSAGALTTLYSFCSQTSCTDGNFPLGGLVQARNGNLYGTTEAGGTYGFGTVFEITPGGKLTVLHSFDGSDGEYPRASLAQASNGNFYGTTEVGGANGDGTVFEITPAGTLTTVYSFCSQTGCTDGENPLAGLVQATNGDFYGTTTHGGANGGGTVFEVTPGGTLTTLYSFCSQAGCTDGSYPQGGLVQATSGELYETASYGGANDDGTVFGITADGNLTTLHSFDGTDGSVPGAALVQAAKGTFYGTTVWGGSSSNCLGGCGTVFNIAQSGTLTTLHSFDGTDGQNPYGGLVQATNGTFYGTTTYGGASSACTGGCGTLFSLSAGLGPFVKTQPTSGKVGAAVEILGTNLTGATSVTFNGTAASFTVSKSGTYISTTVPSGATTGYIEVTTASGTTLTSNVKFRVP